MAKVTLETLASGHLDVEVLNANFAAIAAALETLLSRDGTLPNQMEADLDLNGHSLLNTSTDAGEPTSLVTLATMQSYVDARASGLVMQEREEQTAVAAQTVFTLTTLEYEAGANNLAVYVDGVRKFPPLDYAETSATVVTFVAPMVGGEIVEFVVNEFLGTITLTPHTHAWGDLIGLPAFATRWPTYAEVTDKPTSFTPSAHVHGAGDITTGRLADARRGVFVQSGAPASPQVGDLWFW